MRHAIEGFGYYCSCTLLFNIVYLLKQMAEGLLEKCRMALKCPQLLTVENIITGLPMLFSLLFLIFGLISTFRIMHSNESVAGVATLGKTIKLHEVEDITGNEYFSCYPLLVLTGLSLPTLSSIYGALLYFVAFFSLGIVYIRKDMFQINPILALLKCNIYKCRDNEENDMIIISKSTKIENGIEIHVNVSGRFLRLK